MRFRFFSAFVVLSIFLWVLPLGILIKPSQEKTTCGGNRAFHMCSMITGKIRPAGTVKITLTNASSAEKEMKSASGGIDPVLSVATQDTFLMASKYRPFDFIPQVSDFISSIDPVPKI